MSDKLQFVGAQLVGDERNRDKLKFVGQSATYFAGVESKSRLLLIRNPR